MDITTVRFDEWQHYDIQRDAVMITLEAITNVGTYHTTVALTEAADLRSKRESFKQYALQCMSLGKEPHEAEFG